MKSLVLMIAFAFPVFAAACPDLSGSYNSPYNSEEMKIHFEIAQSNCDWILVSSIVQRGGVSATSARYPLNGEPAHNCLMDVFNNCGTLKSTPAGIEKIDPQSHGIVDDEHGFCQFPSSVLTKDARGNLVESIPVAECEDGYRGKLNPRIYPKR